jgi:hypothetical protein
MLKYVSNTGLITQWKLMIMTQNAGTVQWEAYRDTEPEYMEQNEMKIFKALEEIVEALHHCLDPDQQRESNGYHYKDCPSQEMKSEILGANFKVDAVIANPDIYKIDGKVIPLAAAQAAVVMEFKKAKTAEKVFEVSFDRVLDIALLV